MGEGSDGYLQVMGMHSWDCTIYLMKLLSREGGGGGEVFLETRREFQCGPCQTDHVSFKSDDFAGTGNLRLMADLAGLKKSPLFSPISSCRRRIV